MEHSHDDLENVEMQIWKYGSLPILFIGLTGNAFIVAILCFTPNVKVRETTTARFLSVMAICDSVFLLSGLLVEWLEQCGFITFNEINIYTCKAEKFIFYVSGDVSIWILCAFSFDRAFAVSRPLVKQRITQKKHATWCILVLFVIAVFKNLHVFWTRGAVLAEAEDQDAEDETLQGFLNGTAGEDVFNMTTDNSTLTTSIMENFTHTSKSSQLFIDTYCGRPGKYANFEFHVRPWLAFVVVNALPFVFICICNCVIVQTLLKTKRQALTSSERGMQQTIFMCLGVSLAFLVCVTPSMVLYIGKKHWTQTPQSQHSYDIAKAISNLLAYLNHAINFFLYCITGETFREEFAYLLWKERVDARKRSVAYEAITKRSLLSQESKISNQ